MTTRSRIDWAEPGIAEVSPGVHRVPLPMPGDSLRAVNVYAIEDGAGITLIDGGWVQESARTELERALRTLDCGLGAITRFLVTHAHRDHYTLAVALRRELGTPIGLGAGERATIDALTSRVHRYAAQVGLLRAAGAPELADAVQAGGSTVDASEEAWEQPDEWLHAGTLELTDRALRVVPTPGHTQGHLVFVSEQDGLLFAGDHVLPHITPSIGFEPVPAASPLTDYLSSLRTVRALPDLRLLPAHGEVTASSHTRVDELVAHHDDRLIATREVVAALGPCSGYEVAATLRWTRRGRAFSSLDELNQMLAVTETVAHLRVLVETGLVQQSDAAGVVAYDVDRGVDQPRVMARSEGEPR